MPLETLPSPNAGVVVVLLNWRRAHDTMACLDSLAVLAGVKPSVMICDNDSNDGSVALLNTYASSSPLAIRVLETGSNLGFAGGVNVGLRAALADPGMRYVWILNNDTQVHPLALNALLEKMAEDPKIGICGSTLLYMDDPTMIQAVGGTFNSWLGTSTHMLGRERYEPIKCRAVDETKMDYVVGASMFVRRSFLEFVGFLSESYFLYCEEIDWATRMRRQAPMFRIGYAPDSLVYHKEGASTGMNDLSGKTYNYFSDYYFITSRVKFASKYYPLRRWSVQLSMLLVAWNRFRRKQWRSCLVALCALVGYVPLGLDPRISNDAP